MKKKGDISINYMFMIFIAVIAVFVIIGLLARWSLGADKFMCVLTGECKAKDGVVDKQTITVNDNTPISTRFTNEVAKHAKICYENMRTNPETQGELCYTVKCCINDDCTSTCTAHGGCSDVGVIVDSSLGLNAKSESKMLCEEFGSKAIIEYDFKENKVMVS